MTADSVSLIAKPPTTTGMSQPKRDVRKPFRSTYEVRPTRSDDSLEGSPYRMAPDGEPPLIIVQLFQFPQVSKSRFCALLLLIAFVWLWCTFSFWAVPAVLMVVGVMCWLTSRERTITVTDAELCVKVACKALRMIKTQRIQMEDLIRLLCVEHVHFYEGHSSPDSTSYALLAVLTGGREVELLTEQGSDELSLDDVLSFEQKINRRLRIQAGVDLRRMTHVHPVGEGNHDPA